MRVLTCLILALSVTQGACGKKSSSAGAASPTPAPGPTVVPPKSDTGGVVTSTLDSSATTSQVVQADANSAVKGTTVTFPPGSLAVSADISIQAGDSLNSASTAADLGLATGTTLTAASPTVVITSSVATNASTAFTVNLQLSSGASLLGGATTAVVYRVTKGADLNKFFTGVLPATQVTLSGTAVSVTTNWFGAYQVITTTADLTGAKDSTTTQPIVLVSQVPSVFSGSWKTACRPCAAPSTCSGQETLAFNGAAIVNTADEFSDNSCQTLADEEVLYATYLNDPTVQEPAGTVAVNITVNHAYSTPKILVRTDAVRHVQRGPSDLDQHRRSA